MPRRSAYVDHVLETLRVFGPVEAKSMFGGWGLYHEGLFFALIAQDALYLKCDDENVARFEAEGLEPFVYEMKGGENIVMHYRAAPVEALENPQVMAEWARLAYGAALRKATGKRRPRKAGAGPRRS
jgi:DNA transformation protein